MENLDSEKVIEWLNSLKKKDKAIDEILAVVNKKRLWRTTVPQYFFNLVGFAAFLTFLYFMYTNFNKEGLLLKVNNVKPPLNIWDYILYVFWLMAPPSYFLWEYIAKFPHKLDSNQMADFKYTQDLASKIWAALLIAFGILLLAKYGIKF